MQVHASLVGVHVVDVQAAGEMEGFAAEADVVAGVEVDGAMCICGRATMVWLAQEEPG